MPKKTTRNAPGSGTIRQRADGTWEARYTVGRDPGTGKQVQKSIYGKTKAEVRKKLTAATHDIDEGTYLTPSRMTVGQWLQKWLDEYTSNLKPYSLRSYRSQVKNHITPFIGAVKVQELTPDMIQRMYNKLHKELNLAPKTLRNIHGILHVALDALVEDGAIKNNPAAACRKRLPKVEKKEMTCIADGDLSRFMEAIKGSPFENLFLTDLFTGMRQGELLGLRWDNIDFDKGCITIDRQLYMPPKGGSYTLEPLKNRKTRIIYPAPFIFTVLKRERTKQLQHRLHAGSMWNEGDLKGLVFTNEFGRYLSHKTVYKHFKKAVESSGIPAVRFHDMRHSYAVAALRSGDDIKLVQENLGHATAAFTLDTYGHVTAQMKAESAARMEGYIQSLQAANSGK